jgi:hypothetical protein
MLHNVNKYVQLFSQQNLLVLHSDRTFWANYKLTVSQVVTKLNARNLVKMTMDAKNSTVQRKADGKFEELYKDYGRCGYCHKSYKLGDCPCCADCGRNARGHRYCRGCYNKYRWD